MYGGMKVLLEPHRSTLRGKAIRIECRPRSHRQAWYIGLVRNLLA